MDVEIVAGTGPVVAQPVRTAADVAALPELDPGRWRRSARRRRSTVGELGATPLIGFAGAPFTLASYLVEGGPSRDHLRTKALMHADPDGLARPGRLGRRGDRRVPARAGLAGASAVQLFDSWAGALSLADYRGSSRRTRPRVLRRVADSVCRACTSASAPASCSSPCATPART